MGLGASIDFASGNKKMPPNWLKEIGLCWLWRLASEPKRLFKRYFLNDLPFICVIIKDFVIINRIK